MYRFAVVTVLFVATSLAQQPFDLKADGDQLTLSIDEEGIGMVDFVKLTERVTGRTFTFSAKEIEAADPVTLKGELRLPKDDFLEFFQTILSTKGLTAVVHGEGEAQIMEIVAAPKKERGAAARYVPEAELESWKAETQAVVTSIDPAHLDVQAAIDRLRPVLIATGVEATLARAGEMLIAQGAGSEVYRVSQMLRLMDQPSNVVFRVVALEHAAGPELASGLRTLVADRESKVVVVAHEATKSLMVSGPLAIVNQVIDLALLLDRPEPK